MTTYSNGSSPSLAATLWPTQAPASNLLRSAVLVVAGSALMTLSAKVQVPMLPVPMTMQTFAVLVIAMAYGARLGTATVAAYLMQGLAGLPVFAGALAGPAYMAGPTGGYLAGFLAAAFVVGTLAERGFDRSVLGTLAANVLGTAIIFALGYGWLTTLVGSDAAFTAGVLPFLPGAALKIALAAAVLPTVWRMVGRRG